MKSKISRGMLSVLLFVDYNDEDDDPTTQPVLMRIWQVWNATTTQKEQITRKILFITSSNHNPSIKIRNLLEKFQDDALLLQEMSLQSKGLKIFAMYTIHWPASLSILITRKIPHPQSRPPPRPHLHHRLRITMITFLKKNQRKHPKNDPTHTWTKTSEE